MRPSITDFVSTTPKIVRTSSAKTAYYVKSVNLFAGCLEHELLHMYSLYMSSPLNTFTAKSLNQYLSYAFWYLLDVESVCRCNIGQL